VLLSEWSLCPENFLLGRVQIPQPERAKHGAVFGVRVQIARCICVSRYKFYCGQVASHVAHSLKGSTGAVGLHPYRLSINTPETVCINRDKPINLIVRVRWSEQ